MAGGGCVDVPSPAAEQYGQGEGGELLWRQPQPVFVGSEQLDHGPSNGGQRPQWRMAFALLDLIRDEQRRPFIRVVVLAVLAISATVVLLVFCGVALSVTAGVVTTTGLIRSARRTRRRRGGRVRFEVRPNGTIST